MRRRIWIMGLGLVCAASMWAWPSDANAHTFTHFGGRKGRAGVTDSAFMWDIGASGGSISWWFQRDALTVDPGDGTGHATAGEFTAMQNRIQPELNKWALWLDVSFPKAANVGAADVIIEFEQTFDVTGQAVPQQANDGAAAQYGNTAGYAGNFEFEIDSPNPEGYIKAGIVDNTPTSFTATPALGGPQLFPHPLIFGPIAIPLPAAAWMGLSALGAMVAVRRGRRRARSRAA